jgi:lipoprotein-releasing system ATP-binding protein
VIHPSTSSGWITKYNTNVKQRNSIKKPLMLSIQNISKSFFQRGMVLNNLSLDVDEGDSVAIMGPSGSGKTTLLNIIGLLDKPESGVITFRGASIAGFTDDESAVYRNRNIGFVFQDHLLLPHLTVSENISLPLLASKNGPEELSGKMSRLKVLMERTGIYSLKDKYPFRISGGEAQRVALVRALANNPSILLADEPTGSLDTKNANILGELLLEINRDFGITIILATHSTELAKKISKIYRLEDGKLTDSSIVL